MNNIDFVIKDLRKWCLMPKEKLLSFGDPKNKEHGFIDNNADILAIAHTDFVGVEPAEFGVLRWDDGNVQVFSPALDDRLGVYALIDVLPRLGLKYDILFTDGEESGNSSAGWFEPKKQYNWIFSVDRMGKAAVMYQYETPQNVKLCSDAGFAVAKGSFSDISSLGQVGCSAFNFGIGYYDEHTMSCSVCPDTFRDQIKKVVRFYNKNKDTFIPHDFIETLRSARYFTRGSTNSWDDDVSGTQWWQKEYADRYEDGEFDDVDVNKCACCGSKLRLSRTAICYECSLYFMQDFGINIEALTKSEQIALASEYYGDNFDADKFMHTEF